MQTKIKIMKKENPITYNLKIATIQIIEELYCSGKFNSYRAACFKYFTKIRKNNVNSGFPQKNFPSFYNNYRNTKSKINKKKQTQKTAILRPAYL